MAAVRIVSLSAKYVSLHALGFLEHVLKEPAIFPGLLEEHAIFQDEPTVTTILIFRRVFVHPNIP